MTDFHESTSGPNKPTGKGTGCHDRPEGPIQIVSVQQTPAGAGGGDGLMDFLKKILKPDETSSGESSSRTHVLRLSYSYSMFSLVIALLAVMIYLVMTLVSLKKPTENPNSAATPIQAEQQALNQAQTALNQANALSSRLNQWLDDHKEGATQPPPPPPPAKPDPELAGAIRGLADSLKLSHGSSSQQTIPYNPVPIYITVPRDYSPGVVSPPEAPRKPLQIMPSLEVLPCTRTQIASAADQAARPDPLCPKPAFVERDYSLDRDKRHALKIGAQYTNNGTDDLVLTDTRAYLDTSEDDLGTLADHTCMVDNASQWGVPHAHGNNHALPLNAVYRTPPEKRILHKTEPQPDFINAKSLYLVLCTTFTNYDRTSSWTSESIYSFGDPPTAATGTPPLTRSLKLDTGPILFSK